MNKRLLRKINTSHDNPPIPTDRFDWSATFEGYEPGDSIGTGRTEQEAIDWLIAEEANLIASSHKGPGDFDTEAEWLAHEAEWPANKRAAR